LSTSRASGAVAGGGDEGGEGSEGGEGGEGGDGGEVKRGRRAWPSYGPRKSR
jgi:hypothetical protein